MKKILNNPNDLITEELEGFTLAYKDLVQLVEPRIIIRRYSKPAAKVAVLIGNGSGHEPAMIGFVGEGFLDANIPGEVFTAPPPIRIVAGIKKVMRDAGVLLFIANHAGDVLNAQAALEITKSEKLNVDSVVLWDDIASAPANRSNERRGIAGQMFPFKIASAAAEEGLSLINLKRIAEKARDNTRTLAVAISSATNPTDGQIMFDLPEDEIEVGMGVHGEGGVGRQKLVKAEELTRIMLDQILADRPYLRGEEVNVLINGMGGTTLMEMFIINRTINKYLLEKGISIYRSKIGNFITTQEMAGFSISLCAMDGELKHFWDAPAKTPYFSC